MRLCWPNYDIWFCYEDIGPHIDMWPVYTPECVASHSMERPRYPKTTYTSPLKPDLLPANVSRRQPGRDRVPFAGVTECCGGCVHEVESNSFGATGMLSPSAVLLKRAWGHGESFGRKPCPGKRDQGSWLLGCGCAYMAFVKSLNHGTLRPPTCSLPGLMELP